MHILTIGPNPNFPTDGMIIRGVHNILKHTFPGYTHKHTLLWDSKLNTEEDFYKGEKFDLIVQTGSPFLWDQMHLSDKWKNLKLCSHVHPNTKVLMLGIGSAILLGHNSIVLEDDVTGFLKSCQVVVRDFKASELLRAYKVSHELLPCPAFLSTLGVEAKESSTSAAVWYDPRHGIAACGWNDRQNFLKYLTEYKRFIEREGVKDIYFVNLIEHPAAIFTGDYNFIRLESPQDVLLMINKHCRILSGRVHCAIPAVAAGRTVRLLAVDSRANTLYDFPSVDKKKLLDSYKDVLLGQKVSSRG